MKLNLKSVTLVSVTSIIQSGSREGGGGGEGDNETLLEHTYFGHIFNIHRDIASIFLTSYAGDL